MVSSVRAHSERIMVDCSTPAKAVARSWSLCGPHDKCCVEIWKNREDGDLGLRSCSMNAISKTRRYRNVETAKRQNSRLQNPLEQVKIAEKWSDVPETPPWEDDEPGKTDCSTCIEWPEALAILNSSTLLITKARSFAFVRSKHGNKAASTICGRSGRWGGLWQQTRLSL